MSEEFPNLLSQNTFLENSTLLNSLLIEIKSLILERSNLLSESILHSTDQISEELSGLLIQSTFLDNTMFQNSLLAEIKSIILDKSNFLSDSFSDLVNSFDNQIPTILINLDKKLTPLLSREFFLSWNKSNFDFLFENFDCLQNNFHKLSTSFSGNFALLNSVITNIPNKSFLSNAVEKIQVNISANRQQLFDLHHSIKENYEVLLDIPKSPSLI
jgi:hypothetical protein